MSPEQLREEEKIPLVPSIFVEGPLDHDLRLQGLLRMALVERDKTHVLVDGKPLTLEEFQATHQHITLGYN